MRADTGEGGTATVAVQLSAVEESPSRMAEARTNLKSRHVAHREGGPWKPKGATVRCRCGDVIGSPAPYTAVAIGELPYGPDVWILEGARLRHVVDGCEAD